jgi:hypothetical protein
MKGPVLMTPSKHDHMSGKLEIKKHPPPRMKINF